jgi:hypothetical protein
MPSPKKRKVRKQIGRVLAKGGTASASDFDTAGLENLLEIGLFGHDGNGGFTHGAVGSALKNNPAGASLAEDAGLETVAELDARMIGTASWDTAVTRYYLTATTTDEGMSAATKSTADSGILHCPAGPDAQTVPKLEDVSNGSAIDFYLKPATWGADRGLTIFYECTDADTVINFRNADDAGASITTKSGVQAAGQNITLLRSAANDADGIIIRVTSSGTGTTALAGWQIAWENRDES